jgi:dipeptidyl aminopeptidase/acylaminoacyl peptidase
MIQNARIPGSDGRAIVYDLLLQKSPAPLVILIHGFKSYKNWGAYDQLATYFHEHGMNFCKFNFSHNGGNAEQVIDFPDLEAFGRNTLGKEMDDLQSMIDHLLNNPEITGYIQQNNIFLMGHSRGGSIAALTAIEDKRIRGFITLNAVTNLKAYFGRFDQERWKSEGLLYIMNGRTKQDMPLYAELLEDFEKQQTRFDILNRIATVNTPCLIVHCINDEAVSVQDAKAIEEAASNAELLLLEEGGHTHGAKQPWNEKELPLPLFTACKAILAFIKKHLT